MKKRSCKIHLVLLGTAAALGGCAPQADGPVDVRRNTYSSQADCQADWGRDPRDCTATTSASTGAVRSYAGPRFYWDRAAGVPRSYDTPERTYSAAPFQGSGAEAGLSSRATGQTTVSAPAPAGRSLSSVSRGGFGSSAHSSAGG